MLGGARSAVSDGASSDAPTGTSLHPRPFRIFQRQLELPRQCVGGRAGPLPRAFALEPQVADAAPPRSDHAADGAKVGPVGVFLVQAPHNVWGHADERAECSCRLDAVLAAVP